MNLLFEKSRTPSYEDVEHILKLPLKTKLASRQVAGKAFPRFEVARWMENQIISCTESAH